MSDPIFISSGIYDATGYKPNHPLSIQRVGSTMRLCEMLGWLDRNAENYVTSPRADYETLTEFHDPQYVSALIDAEISGKTSQEVRERHKLGTMENPVFAGLYERASTSVGGSMEAARQALEHGIGYHPAGGTHHGLPAQASGFCYFNDPVFAVRTFQDAGVERIAYIDVDAHHGDGVEYAFENQKNVLTLSLHEENRWPNTGPTGFDKQKSIANIMLPRSINDAEYQLLVEEIALPIVRDFKPQAIVMTCGADGLKGDPLSAMALSNLTLWQVINEFCALVPACAVLGGGGYNPWTVTRFWTGLWGMFNGFTMPDALRVDAREMMAAFESDLVDEEDVEEDWLNKLVDQKVADKVRPQVRDILKLFK